MSAGLSDTILAASPDPTKPGRRLFAITPGSAVLPDDLRGLIAASDGTATLQGVDNADGDTVDVLLVAGTLYPLSVKRVTAFTGSGLVGVA
ncbi:MAG: hypothetical protein IPM13_10315 [Phycisphaerales bacterium]|nr:hypothetical protein [Phycisphaerales bacterium]